MVTSEVYYVYDDFKICWSFQKCNDLSLKHIEKKNIWWMMPIIIHLDKNIVSNNGKCYNLLSQAIHDNLDQISI